MNGSSTHTSDSAMDRCAADTLATTDHRSWVLVGVGLALFVLNLDLTIVNLALPTLSETFQADLSTLQWINNIYSIAFAALVMVFGKAADRFGHRNCFLLGTALFLLGSVLAGAAGNVSSVLAGRMLQGVGMAGAFVTTFTLVGKSFPPEQQGKALGLVVLFAALAQAVGPTVGGYLVEYVGWRWTFYINIPFCVISIAIIQFTCKPFRESTSQKIHIPSAVLFSLAFFIITLAFNECRNWGISDAKTLCLFGVGVLMLGFTVYWQKNLAEPLLDVKLFSNRLYLGVNLYRPLMQLCFGALMFVLPLYLQNGQGMNPLHSGFMLLFVTGALAISSPIAGKLNASIGATKLVIIAHVIALIGYVVLALAPSATGMTGLALGLVLIGINVGVMYPATNFLALSNVTPDQKGVGFGIFTANTYFLFSLGVALAGFVLAQTGIQTFHALELQQLASSGVHISEQQLLGFISGSQPLSELGKLYGAQADVALHIAKVAFSHAFSMLMYLLAATTALGLCLAIAYRK